MLEGFGTVREGRNFFLHEQTLPCMTFDLMHSRASNKYRLFRIFRIFKHEKVKNTDD